MLRYPCLVLDHDDTVVQSERDVNFPFFKYILNEFRPGTAVTLQEYTDGCYHLGFADMCRKNYGFSEQELTDEYEGWKKYIRTNVPAPFLGIERVIRRQREQGGILCVVSHSCEENITRDYMAHFGILPDEISGWDLPEEHRKPSAYPLERIMEKYSLAPEQLLVVDDMKPAYDMASRVGVPIAFAAWSRKDCPELSSEMKQLCDFSFDSPAQLEQFLFDPLTDMI